jgi:uncharacterized protein YfaS (alpha-2-macroglobulin family)
MQKAHGGYTLWGDGAYESWLSAYVAGFLLDARQEGFTVPDAMVRKGQDWLLQELQQAPNRFPSLPASMTASGARPAARDWNLLRDGHQRFAEMAHMAYMLARDQKAPLATLRLLHDRYRDRARSPLPLVHLALALKLTGDETRARQALDDAMARTYGIGTLESGYTYEWLGDYGSGVRDLALAYALLNRHRVQHERRENLLFDLAERLGPRQYFSTQERLALYLAARAAGAVAGDAEWTALLKTGDKSTAVASRTTESRSFDAAALARGVALTNSTGAALFVEIDASGYPVKAPAPRSDVIELKRDWFDLEGKPLTSRQFKVGDVLIVRVQARSKQRVEDALIVDRIPAGFEVENLNLSQGPKAESLQVGGVDVAGALADERLKHREYRDDRYVAAARLDGRWLNVFYLLRIVSPGRYVVPATFAEDMYRPELRAVGAAEAPIVIVDPRAGKAAAETAVAGVTPPAASAAAGVPAGAASAASMPR